MRGKAEMGDIRALKELWKAAFGDPDEVIDAYFSAFYSPERAVFEKLGGEIVSACHIMPLGELALPCGEREKCAAVYALATLPAYRMRGLAARVTENAVRAARELGFSSVVLHPAEKKLFAFYEKHGGFETMFRVSESRPAAGGIMAAPERMSPAEYRAIRERRLRGRLHIDHDERSLAFQETLCALSGGGLFRAGDGCFIAEGEEIKELLCAEDACGGGYGAARMPASSDAGKPFGMLSRPGGTQGLPADGWMGPAFD